MSSEGIARRLGRGAGRLDEGLGRLILAFALLTLSIQVLGWVGWLGPMGLLTLHGAIALGLAARGPSVSDVTRQTVSSTSLLQSQARPLIVAFLVPYATFLAAMLLRPPMLGDDLGYHLPTAVQWIQAGHIRDYLPFQATGCFPMNGECLSFWLLVWTHDDSFASLLNLLLFPAVLAVFVRVGRAVRIGDEYSFAAGTLFLFTPGVCWTQAGSNKVDTYAVLLLLAGLAWILEIGAKRGGRREVALAAIALGLSAGVKYTSVLLGGLLALAAGWAALGGDPERLGRTQARRVLLAGVAIATAVVVLAGYWYARNLLRMGNPFHPFEVSPGEAKLHPGSIAISLRHVIGRRILSLGLLFLLPGVLLAPLLHVWSKGDGGRLALAVYLLPVPLTILWAMAPQCAVNPMDAWRYNLFGTALAWLCAARTAESIRPGPASLAMGTAAVAFSDLLDLADVIDLGYALESPIPWRVAGLGLTLLGALLLDGRIRDRRTGACLVLALGLGLLSLHMIRVDPARRPGRFRNLPGRDLETLDRLIEQAPPRRIAVSGVLRVFPFHGSRFQHRLVYLAIDRDGAALAHRDPARGPCGEPQEALWLERVDASGVSLLVFGAPEPESGFPIEDLWASARPERFRKAIDRPALHVYEVMR